MDDFYGQFLVDFIKEMRKDCLGFHQSETIALMTCLSMNLFLEESGVLVFLSPVLPVSYLRF